MSKTPPKRVEWIVARLIPPARREEVLGDLQERCEGPAQYLLDALRTVPHVIASQMRRATDFRLVILEGFALFIAFLTAPGKPGGRPLIFEPGLQPSMRPSSGLLAIVIPVVVAVVVLRFIDTYSPPVRRTRMVMLAQSALAVAVSYGADELLRTSHPALALPRSALTTGGVLGLFLLWTLRSAMRSRGDAARPATPSSSGERPMGEQDFQRGIEELHITVRRRNSVGAALSLFLIVAFAPALVPHASTLSRTGALLIEIGAAYIGLQILLLAIRTGRLDSKRIEPAEYARVYRAALVRQRDYHLGSSFWSRMIIFIPGCLVFCAGLAEAEPGTARTDAVSAIFLLALALAAVRLNSNVARKYQRKIDRLDAAGKSSGGKTS